MDTNEITYKATDKSIAIKIFSFETDKPIPYNPVIEYNSFEIPSRDILNNPKKIFYNEVKIELKANNIQISDKIMLTVHYSNTEGVIPNDKNNIH